MFKEVSCGKCQKLYEKNVETKGQTHICYDCALQSLTGGQHPEEGDFNSSRIMSGEMSDDERRWLAEDLRSVDWATCQPDPDDSDDQE